MTTTKAVQVHQIAPMVIEYDQKSKSCGSPFMQSKVKQRSQNQQTPFLLINSNPTCIPTAVVHLTFHKVQPLLARPLSKRNCLYYRQNNIP